jgi:hypothetical protein
MVVHVLLLPWRSHVFIGKIRLGLQHPIID